MRSFCTILISIISIYCFAQDPPPDGLVGEDLRNWLKENWYDGHHSSVGYNSARQEMYSNIDNEGGNVYCVYSGFFQESEFTTYLNPINAEHTVPQMLFNSNEPMKSDVHHVFPTHQDVNSARGNLPFEEIDDPTTDNWYIGDAVGIMTSSMIPFDNINLYSERDINVAFEPREDHKGNAARAIFYFYTMYPNQAGNISQLGEVMELYQWHIQDPVDSQEITRNNKTQEVQGNYNPYISLPELVQLAWDIPSEVGELYPVEIKIYPNPAQNQMIISGWTKEGLYEIYHANGSLLMNGSLKNGTISISELDKGVYLLKLLSESSLHSRKIVKF